MANINKALKELIEEINIGKEFPDALFDVSSKYQVSAVKLSKMYDEQQIE